MTSLPKRGSTTTTLLSDARYRRRRASVCTFRNLFLELGHSLFFFLLLVDSFIHAPKQNTIKRKGRAYTRQALPSGGFSRTYAGGRVAFSSRLAVFRSHLAPSAFLELSSLLGPAFCGEAFSGFTKRRFGQPINSISMT